MKNYFCKPLRRGKKAKIRVFLLGAAAIALFLLSTALPAYKAILQLVSALLLLLLIQISNRFLLTQYRYGLEDGYLLLSTRQGKKERHLGGIPITAKTLLLDREAYENQKQNYPVSSRFSYCQNLFPENPYYLLAPEEKGYLLLIFEPDETLCTLIQEQILDGESR